MPPGVDYINRVSFGPHENTEVPYPPTPLCAPCGEPTPVPLMHETPLSASAPFPASVFSEDLPPADIASHVSQLSTQAIVDCQFRNRVSDCSTASFSNRVHEVKHGKERHVDS